MRAYLTDLKVVLRPLWLFLLLQVFVTVAFLLVPQGPDVLFGVIENYSGLFRAEVSMRFVRIAPFFCIVLALAYWSIASELCSRLILHASDFSSRRIPPARVLRRRNLQRDVPKVLYYFPVLIVMIAFTNSFFSRIEAEDEWHVTAYALIIVSLLALLFLLYHLRYGRLSRPLFYRRIGIARLRSAMQRSGFWYNRYFRLLVGVTLPVLALCAFAPPVFYEVLGSTMFICLGFGVWTVMYTLVELLYRVWPLPVQLPYKAILLVWLLVASRIDKDHPARTLPGSSGDTRPELSAHFNRWVAHRAGPQRDTVPVIFVAAEGGALRTGCFSAMMLAVLQDSFPQMRRHIYAYSGVSGGSVGIGVFYQMSRHLADTPDYTTRVKEFFRHDFLAPVTGKLVFGEPFNWMSPWPIRAGDRVIALEQSWEQAWAQCTRYDPVAKQRFSESWVGLNSSDSTAAALFINTTEAESGMKGVISTLRFPEDWFFQSKDVMARLKGRDIPYSTALGMSARFPLVSPGAALYDEQERTLYHYVDGGYYENKGASTLYEVMRYCREQLPPGTVIRPVVVQLAFDPDPYQKPTSIHWLNELREPLSGILNVRSSHTRYASAVLQDFVRKNNGLYIPFTVGYAARAVPMNWTLSGYALEKIETRCKDLLRNTARDPRMDEFRALLTDLK